MLNLGGLFGAILALSMNANNRSGTSAARLDKSSYIALIGVAASGIGFSLLAQDPAKLTKSDGTPVVMPQMDFKKELRMLLQGLKDVNIWQMAPLFMSCMWHEVVLFNFMNAGLYNVRSRTANAGVYYIGRIVASFTFQYACDYHHRTRKRVATAVTFVAAHLIIGFILTLMVFCGFQRIKDSHDLDLTDKRAAIGWFIFFIFGSLETMASSMSKSIRVQTNTILFLQVTGLLELSLSEMQLKSIVLLDGSGCSLEVRTDYLRLFDVVSWRCSIMGAGYSHS